MAHNLNIRAGQYGFAFRGDRKDIWHHHGQIAQEGWTVDDWAKNANLDWHAVKVPALADLSALNLSPSNAWERMRVENRHFIARSDNGHILSPGTVTDIYKIVQPREILDFFNEYVGHDERFQIDTAMCLKNGELIAATAVFNGDTDVVGEKHRARLLATTSMDGSGASIFKGLMTRVVCNNTLSTGLAEKDTPVISVRHNTTFKPDRVRAELATIAQGFAKYKAMGEAMAARKFQPVDVSAFFKLTLDIDPKAKESEISTNKRNQFESLVDCYQYGTRREGLDSNTGWSMLQAVTRFCDHNKSVRGSDGTSTGVANQRFLSANFGTGAQMKAAAVQYLDDMADGEFLRAVQTATRNASEAPPSDGDAFANLLKTSFRPKSER